MKYADNKMSDVQIAYIGGGSRGWAWTFMTDLSMDDSLSGTIRLYDIDEEAAKHNEIIGNHLGSPREVVTRMLRYFQNEGMVKLSRGTVEVTDKEKLEQLTDNP